MPAVVPYHITSLRDVARGLNVKSGIFLKFFSTSFFPPTPRDYFLRQPVLLLSSFSFFSTRRRMKMSQQPWWTLSSPQEVRRMEGRPRVRFLLSKRSRDFFPRYGSLPRQVDSDLFDSVSVSFQPLFPSLSVRGQGRAPFSHKRIFHHVSLSLRST